MVYDFGGWATRNDLRCSDGRTIKRNAFAENDGQTVPLVWNHQHNEPGNVLGHALLRNRDEGVYCYCTFNQTDMAKTAKELVSHGDICSLSIYANQLKQNGGDVLHGKIREVSLVLAGANPGAFIDSVMAHGEESDEEAYIFTGEELEFAHAEETKEENKEMADAKEKTVQDVIDSMTEEQKTVMYALVGAAAEGAADDKEEEKEMKHNVFDSETEESAVLTHAEFDAMLADAKKNGSLKDAYLAHATDASGNTVNYGIANIDYMFPDAQLANKTPDMISREMEWVGEFMNGAKHLPFSRVKSMQANITADEARAKGYVKGNRKAEEVIVLLRRTTTPTTIYKKQKLDRDDIIDIIDFDVVVWLKAEMRMMLNEEIARAGLVGDGRELSDDDHIPETNIRPIWKDDELFAVRKTVTVSPNATEDDIAKAAIRAAVKAHKDYKGSGNPIFFTTEDFLTDCLLLEDSTGRPLYDSVDKLATKMRVRKFVTVPVMENLTREGTGTDTNTYKLLGIMVNPIDYAYGADKGGAVAMFDDFDINFNQQIYLIETRCSGALIKPYSAIILEQVIPASVDGE